MTPTRTNPTLLQGGTTVHLLRGSKYAGAWTLTEVGEPDANGWVAIKDGRRQWFTQAADAFATEAEARAEGRNRRQPRQVRTPQPLYGDFAQLAAFYGKAAR